MIRHDSQRGWFAYALQERMAKNNKIWLLTGDLGFGMLDGIRDTYPDRFCNVGAAEQTLLDVACGLALSGRIVFVYSITPFLLYRGFETLRTYIDHERLNVKLVGSGRDDDYKHDGYSHNAEDVKDILHNLKQVHTWWPETKEEASVYVLKMLAYDGPDFISLRR